MRSYWPDDIINLPVLKASECSALGNKLVTACKTVEQELLSKGTPLQQEIVWAREDLENALANLDSALVPLPPADTQAAKDADRLVDGRWGGFRGWLDSVLSLPAAEVPEYAQLETLNATLFADGLTFLSTSYAEEWQASQARLTAIETGGYEAAITAQGGGTQLKTLRDAHAAYGVALGISTEPSVTVNPVVKQHFDAVRCAMRVYVVRVMAWIDDARAPERRGYADRLIRAVAEWETSTSSSSSSSGAGTSGGSSETGGETTP